MAWRRFWAWPWELRQQGVLGINARNTDLVLPLNPRRFYPRLDDKALTKSICHAQGIAVPETYAILECYGDIRHVTDVFRQRPQFVIKPCRGAGGRGVLVVADHDGRTFRTSSGRAYPLAEVKHHLSTTLSGLYSLGGCPDRAIVEERITRHPVFDHLAFGGTPDIRIVVYRYQPAMAMLRLPTRESDGRANLHQGAVGLGIELDTGRTSGGVWHSRAISRHPETDAPIQGIEVPFWEKVLDTAARLSRALELGYVGIDIVLDPTRGPIVLEANARPGLAIQIANARGLLTCGLTGEQPVEAAQRTTPVLPSAASVAAVQSLDATESCRYSI